MNRTFFSVLFDTAFTGCAAFTVAFVATAYFFTPETALAIAVAVAALAMLAVYLILQKKRREYTATEKKTDYRERVLDELCFLPPKDAEDAIRKACLLLGKPSVRKNGRVLLGEREELFTRFSFSPLREDDVATVFAQKKAGKTALLYARAFTPEAKEFVKRLPRVVLKDGQDTFALFEKANFFPNITTVLSESKPKAPQKKPNFFQKSHDKGFFTSGALLLFLSFFTPFRAYYVFVGIILTAFSVFCHFFGKTEETKT